MIGFGKQMGETQDHGQRSVFARQVAAIPAIAARAQEDLQSPYTALLEKIFSEGEYSSNEAP